MPPPTSTPTPPSAPSIDSNESINPGEIRLQWDPVPRAAIYYVEQKNQRALRPDNWPKLPSPNDFPNVTVTITATSDKVTAVIDGLEPGKKFKHRVRAHNTHGDSDHSNEEETEALPLPVPTNFTGTATKKDAAGRLVLDLDWDDVLPGTGITYEVQQKRGKRLWELWESEWETLPFNVYSIHFNGSEAEIRYPVDGRDYEHRVRSVNAHSYHSEWASIKTTVPAGIPHLGHQADHTVKYEASTTYPPTSDISNAISTAATAWDNAVGGSWPNLRVCKSGSTDCNVRNTDGHTVTIDVVSGEDEESPGKGSEKDLVWTSIPLVGDADCGAKIACVKLGPDQGCRRRQGLY